MDPAVTPITTDEIKAKIEALTAFRDKCIRDLKYIDLGMFGKLAQDLAALERLKSFVEYDALCETRDKAGAGTMVPYRLPPGVSFFHPAQETP